MKKEIWKDVVGYECLYQVSCLGNVKALCVEKYRGNNKHKQPEKLLKLKAQNIGYLQATLCDKKINKTFSVHRLVAIAFIPNPKNKPHVNHINGVKTNNTVDNLEWATPSENVLHAFRTGLKTQHKGEKCTSSKLKEVDVIEIYLSYKPQIELSKLYNMSRGQINRIKKGNAWKETTEQLNKRIKKC